MSRRFIYIFFSVNKIVVLLQLILPTSNKAVCRQWSKCDSSVRFLFLYMHVHTHPLHIDIMCMYIYISSNPNIHNPTYCFKKNNQPNQLLNYIITKMYRFMPFPFSSPLFSRFNIPRNSPGTSRKISVSPFPPDAFFGPGGTMWGLETLRLTFEVSESLGC